MPVRILIVPNIRHETARLAACELVTWLVGGGYEPVIATDHASGCGLEAYAVPPTEIGTPELVVALGGDGTILAAVHLLGEVEVPILGVNLGHLGFLAGASAEQMRESVEAALAGECRIERRSTLEAHVVMDGREVGRYRALNEVALARGASARVVRVALSINGVPMSEFDGDGIVVATATGSTAYALSAGGPIVSPNLECGVVIPVAPHTLFRRAIVIAPSDVVEIRLPDEARREACVTVDGDPTPCRQAIESITVKHCDHDVLLAKLDGRDFYEVVRSEFYGGR